MIPFPKVKSHQLASRFNCDSLLVRERLLPDDIS